MAKIKLFACLLYEDSMAENWFEKACLYGIPFYYVFHDKDEKKPHYHVFFNPPNSISVNTAKELIATIGGANEEILRVISKRGYLRYLIHLDNPEKYQYSMTDVKTGCGAVYDDKSISSDEECKMLEFDTIQEMIDFIDDHDVVAYCDFVRICLGHKRDWLKVLLSSKGRVIDKYIKSRYWAIETNVRRFH